MSTTSPLSHVPATACQNFTLSLAQVIGAAFFIALCAQIYIPLFFTPVPLSCQTLAVMLIGARLGSTKGALSALAYLAGGLLNLPVFAAANFGLATLLGPTGGYALGFIVQAFIVGWYVEQRSSSGQTLKACLLACTLQLALGALWLSHFVGFTSAWQLGIAPFMVGELAKSLALTAYLTLTSQAIQKTI